MPLDAIKTEVRGRIAADVDRAEPQRRLVRRSEYRKRRSRSWTASSTNLFRPSKKSPAPALTARNSEPCSSKRPRPPTAPFTRRMRQSGRARNVSRRSSRGRFELSAGMQSIAADAHLHRRGSAASLADMHGATPRTCKSDTEDDARATLAVIAAQVSADKSVPLLMLHEILRRLGEAEVPLDAAQIEQRLRAKADEYQELRERLGRLTNDDPRVQTLRREAAGLIDQGRFDEADAKPFARPRRSTSRPSRSWNRSPCVGARAPPRAAPSAPPLPACASDYRTAAAHFAEAASDCRQMTTPSAWNYRLSQAACALRPGLGVRRQLRRLREASVVYRDRRFSSFGASGCRSTGR